MNFTVVGLGGNLEGTLQALTAARSFLGAVLDTTRFSSLYRTNPQVDTDQSPFWNAAASGFWSGTPEGLLERLLMWEAGVGRVRNPDRPKGPRLLDLDLLVFGDTVRLSDRLGIPHPGLAVRRFALEPLVELHPEAKDPVSGRLWRAILEGLPDQGVDRTGRTW